MEKPFELNMLELGGGVLGLCPLPAAPDARARLAGFAPGLVVSMTPVAEMAARGARDLPEWLAGQGIGWAGFAVEDFGAPGAEAQALWPALAARIRAGLAGGGRVALHCRAGLGRTGMVALRLMVEAGEAPAAALARLRAARPGTVETEAQYAWAASPALTEDER